MKRSLRFIIIFIPMLSHVVSETKDPAEDCDFINPPTDVRNKDNNAMLENNDKIKTDRIAAELTIDASKYEDEAASLRAIIQEHFEGPYDPRRRYIICMQGATSSGKSTFSKKLHRMFTENGINSYLLPLDSFYNSPDCPLEEKDDYDFDNPASLNWEAIQKVLEAIRDNKDFIPYYIRAKSHSEKASFKDVPNPKPSVVIIEGIYAFNTINDQVFNICEYDPYNSKKVIENGYIKSNFSMGDFKILKIQMTHCASKLLSIRLGRDLLLGKPKQTVIDRFYDKILPDTLRWVYSPVYHGYIKVIHGNFNVKKIRMLTDELSLYFFGRMVNGSLEAKDGDFWAESMVECTGECKKNGIPSIILDDD